METSGKYIKGSGSFEIKELSSQDSVLRDLDVSKQFWECTSAGTFAEIQPYAYGRGRFWLYKGGTSNTVTVSFIDDDLLPVNVGGYRFEIGSTEAVTLVKSGSAVLFSTVTSYIENNTWYEIEWGRELDGTFTIKIRGGAFGENFVLVDVSGGSGSNPVVDNTFTESIYQVLDLDIGDRYIPGVQKEGVAQ